MYEEVAIALECEDAGIDQELEDNIYYCEKFITGKLLNDELPYCAIWASFVFQGLERSRITNGSIEKYFSTRKKLVPEPLLPDRYVTKTLDQAKGQAMRFLRWKPSEEVPIPIENAENNSMEIDDDIYTCTENWEKHKKIDLKPDNEGYFQKKLSFK